jgi:hypothetical protein
MVLCWNILSSKCVVDQLSLFAARVIKTINENDNFVNTAVHSNGEYTFIVENYCILCELGTILLYNYVAKISSLQIYGYVYKTLITR